MELAFLGGWGWNVQQNRAKKFFRGELRENCLVSFHSPFFVTVRKMWSDWERNERTDGGKWRKFQRNERELGYVVRTRTSQTTSTICTPIISPFPLCQIWVFLSCISIREGGGKRSLFVASLFGFVCCHFGSIVDTLNRRDQSLHFRPIVNRSTEREKNSSFSKCAFLCFCAVWHEL